MEKRLVITGIITVVFGFIVLAVISCELYTLRTGVPTSASFPRARRKIIKILEKEREANSQTQPFTIIDLGSGNGQLAWDIALAIPSAHIIGVEISFLPWLFSVIRQKLMGPKNLEYKRVDFFPYDCSTADAVVTYVTENIIERVSHKLRKELKPGALVVANDVWLLGDWQPIETQANNTLGIVDSKIYVYRQA